MILQITNLYKVVFDPVIVLDGLPSLDLLSPHVDDRVAQIWVLGGGVVPPNHTVAHCVVWDSKTCCYL